MFSLVLCFALFKIVRCFRNFSCNFYFRLEDFLIFLVVQGLKCFICFNLISATGKHSSYSESIMLRKLIYASLKFFHCVTLLQFMYIIFLYIFNLGFLLRTFTNHRTAGEGGGHFFNSSLPLPPASETLRH